MEQKATFESGRKLDLVVQWLTEQVANRLRAQAFGRIQIELTFERGAVKRAKLVDEVTVDDLTDRERELVLRDRASQTKGEG